MSSVRVIVEAGQMECQEVQLLANLRKLMKIFRLHFQDDSKEDQKDKHSQEYFGITSRVTACLFMLLSSYEDFGLYEVQTLLQEMIDFFPLTEDNLITKQKEDILQFNINCMDLILTCIPYLHTTFEESQDPKVDQISENITESMSTYATNELKIFSTLNGKLITPLQSKLLHSLVSCCVKLLKWVSTETRISVMEAVYKTLEESKHFNVRKVVLQAIFEM